MINIGAWDKKCFKIRFTNSQENSTFVICVSVYKMKYTMHVCLVNHCYPTIVPAQAELSRLSPSLLCSLICSTFHFTDTYYLMKSYISLTDENTLPIQEDFNETFLSWKIIILGKRYKVRIAILDLTNILLVPQTPWFSTRFHPRLLTGKVTDFPSEYMPLIKSTVLLKGLCH